MPIKIARSLNSGAQTAPYFLQPSQNSRGGNAMDLQLKLRLWQSLHFVDRASEQKSPVAYRRGAGNIFERPGFFAERGPARCRKIQRAGGRKLGAVEFSYLQFSTDLGKLRRATHFSLDIKTAAPAYIAAKSEPAQLAQGHSVPLHLQP